ncbi:ATP-binding cassette domain-containing protein [Pendulispora rubella]|uniref:ATP-binding cassette domain-containing protein n=1 Tax=Pendulispora rubella TaxID=2741070 RepID=A0ABZ2LGI1_9BACT
MKRRFLAPEIIQTSAMDCGPAALTSLLGGFGISASYGRLREVCQTDVDGTAIESLEDLAVRLGLEAAQVMVPVDYLFVREIDVFPAILVTRDPVGALHFVVAWRRVGTRIQIMDPGRGRVWVSEATLRTLTFVHRIPIPAETWRRWVESEEPQAAFNGEFARLGAPTEGARLLAVARADSTWRSYAVLDAALRMTRNLVAEGVIGRGAAASALLTHLFEETVPDVRDITQLDDERLLIPAQYWSAAPTGTAPNGVEQVMLAGAVLVRAFGVRASSRPPVLQDALEAALRATPEQRPLRHIGGMLRQDGVLAPAVVLACIVASAIGGAIEALLLRSMIDVGRHLGIIEQRLAGIGALAALFGILLLFDVAFAGGVSRIGRRLEARLRVAFLSKIPRLHDRYFQSRPASDMAHRCHTIHPVQELPLLGGRVLRAVMDLLVIGAGLVWIDSRNWLLVLLAISVSTSLPWLAYRRIAERDLRARSFDGALARFYLDGLLGLSAVRAHAAERSVRQQHARVTSEWARAAIDRIRASTTVDALQLAIGSSLAVLLVFAYLAHTPEPAAVLLVLYWTLTIPALGQDLARTVLLYPSMRSRLLRLVEPLEALEDRDEASSIRRQVPSDGPEPHVAICDVSVHAGGHTILRNVDVVIPRGAHVAIIGPSGSGKSSLVGLLLGWHRPASGSVVVDGLPLRGTHQTRVRNELAWVDPSVHVWNRTLLANLEYGATEHGRRGFGTVLEDADLLGLLERLPEGLQTSLGEGGALVAGGEGQRVRLGRAMMRVPKLVILDEAFRGLDRESRHTLMNRARRRWKDVTLLCATHDVTETREFDHVLVLENGRVREQGAPEDLLTRVDSRYRTMIEAEEKLHRTLWRDHAWRRVTIRDGQLAESEITPLERNEALT